MSGGYYHTPPKPISTRVKCPVCHQEVYSRAGIHPQCAVRQSEPPTPNKRAVVVTGPAVGTELAPDRTPAAPADPTSLVISSAPRTAAH